MSEKAFQNYTAQRMQRLGASTTNHEGQTNVPDLSYGIDRVNGWIEFKFADNYPVRETTKIKWKHPLTPGQRNFLNHRGKTGGYCWIMAKVKNDTHLIHWSYANSFYKGVTRDELERISLWTWRKNVDYQQLIRALKDSDHGQREDKVGED